MRAGSPGGVYPRAVSLVHRELSGRLRGWGVARADRILAAVSGGADSIALLHALAALDQRVSVGHVHHGLRGAEADADEEFVREAARALGVPCRVRRIDAGRRDGRSPEARARAGRYAALEALRAECGAVWTATAHTVDDQAETVLLRALRGTGVEGLAGIEPRCRQRRLIRPLLRAGRADLRDYLRARGLAWREDRTNADLEVPRNRLRAHVLPVLETMQPGAARRLAALANAAREGRGNGEAELRDVLDAAVKPCAGGVWIDPGPLEELGPAGATRAWRAILVRTGLGDRISRVHLERIRAFATGGRTGAALSLPGPFALVWERGGLRLGPAPRPERTLKARFVPTR